MAKKEVLDDFTPIEKKTIEDDFIPIEDTKKKSTSYSSPFVEPPKTDSIISEKKTESESPSIYSELDSRPPQKLPKTEIDSTTFVVDPNIKTGDIEFTNVTEELSPEQKVKEDQRGMQNYIGSKKTSTEIKQEVESYVGEQQMQSNKPVGEFVSPSDYGIDELGLKQIDTLTDLVSKNHKEEDFGIILKDYLKEKYKSDKDNFVEQFQKIVVSNNDESKNSLIQQALAYKAQKLNKDFEILNARGANIVYDNYKKTEKEYKDIYDNYGLNELAETQKELDGMLDIINSKKIEYEENPSPIKQAEYLSLEENYNQKLQELKQKYPEEKLIEIQTKKNEVENKLNKFSQEEIDIVNQFGELIGEFENVSNANKNYVKYLPDVEKKLKKQEVVDKIIANEDGFADSLGINPIQRQMKEITGNVWNALVDSGLGIIELSKDAVDFTQGYSGFDSAIDDIKGFTNDYLKISTSNIPLVEKNGDLNWYRLPALVAKTATDMAILLYGANKFTKAGQMVMGGTKSMQNAGLIMSSMMQTYDDYKDQAIKNGWKESDAVLFGLGTSALVSALETVSPNASILGTQLEKKALQEAFKTASSNGGLDVFYNTLLKEAPKEVMQEVLQGYGEKISAYFSNKLNSDGNVRLDDEMTNNELLETAILTYATTVLMSGGAGYANKDAVRASALYQASQNYEAFKIHIQEQIGAGNISEKNGKKLIDEVAQSLMVLNKMPQELDDEKKQKILPLLIEKTELEEKKKNTDDSFNQMYDKNIDVINEQITGILNDKETKPTQNEVIETEKTDTVNKGQETAKGNEEQQKEIDDKIEPEEKITPAEISENVLSLMTEEEQIDYQVALEEGDSGFINKLKEKYETKTEPIKITEDDAENEYINTKFTEEDNLEQEPSITVIEDKTKTVEGIGEQEINQIVKEIDEKINNATDVQVVSIDDLDTDETRFQNRTKLNQQIINEISSNWQDANQDPIHVWMDSKTGKTYVLSGHHRYYGAKNAGVKAVKIIDRTNDFTEEQAIKFAKEEANANRSMESVVDRASALRNKIKKGETKEEINKFLEREGKNKTKVQNFAALNPKGKTMDMLIQFEESGDVQTQKETETRADWIGEAMRTIGGLTENHENEMFDFLMDKGVSKRITNKADFLQKVRASFTPLTPESPLNLKRFQTKTTGEVAYEEDVENKKQQIAVVQNKINELSERFTNPKNENYISTQDKDYESVRKIADEKLVKLDAERKILTKQLEDIYRNKKNYTGAKTTGSLFDFDETDTTKENAKKIADKIREGKLKGGANVGIPLFKQAWNGAIEVIASFVENNPELIDKVQKGIEKGIAYLKQSEYYKSLSEKGKKHLEEKLKNKFPAPTVKKEKVKKEEKPESEKTKKHKLGIRVLASDKLPQEVKDGLEKRGIEYTPKGVKLSEKEATSFFEVYKNNGELNTLELMLRSLDNGILPDVRVALSQLLYKEYALMAAQETDIEKQNEYTEKALDVLYFAQKVGADLGRGVNMQKGWKTILGILPKSAVTAVMQDIEKRNEYELGDRKEKFNDAKKALDEFLKTDEGQRIIEEEVKKEIDKRGEKLYGKETKKKIDDWLDSLKIKTPGIQSNIFGLPIAVYNGTIEGIRVSIHMGGFVANVIDDAVKDLKTKFGDEFDEKGFRESFGGAPPEIKKRKGGKSKKMTDSELQEIKEKKKMLGLQGKLKELNELLENPEAAKKAIEQKEKELEERRSKKEKEDAKFDSELQEIKEKKKMLKLIEKFDFLEPLQRKQMLAESIEYATKNGYLSNIEYSNIAAKTLGMEFLSDADKKTIMDATTAIANVDKAAKEYLENPNKKTSLALKNAMYEGRMANGKLSQFFKEKKTMGGMFSSFIQGNLLTTTSLAANVYYNALNAPIRFVQNAIASVLDYLESQLAKISFLSKIFDEKRTSDFAKGLRGYIVGSKIGLVEGVKQLKTGSLPDDLYTRDMTTALHPIDAMSRFYAGLTKKERIAFYDQIKNVTEATLGISPEIMFRLLNLGDKPFRRGAEYLRLYEIVNIDIKERKKELVKKSEKEELSKEEKKELEDIASGLEFEKRTLLPSDKILKEIEKFGLEATYQNENFVYSMIKSFSRSQKKMDENKRNISSKQPLAIRKFNIALEKFISGTKEVAIKSQLPYINTPLNIAADLYLTSNPLAAFMVGISRGVQGDRKGANMMFAKAMIGYMISNVATWLLANGVITAGADDDEDKVRNFKYAMGEKPKGFNYDLLVRIMNGEPNNGYQKGDYVFDYSKAGIVGATFYAHAEITKDMSKEQIAEMHLLDKMAKMGIGSLKSALDQSFLTGTNQLLNALLEGGYAADKWMVQTSNAMKAIFIPNTLTKFSNIDNEFLRDAKDPDVYNWIANNWKNQLFAGKDLPKKVDIWGNYVSSTPADRSAFFYQLFDFTKGSAIPNNTFGMELYRIWKETGEKKVMPPPINDEVTYTKDGDEKSTTIKLSPSEKSDMAVYVGKQRKNLVNQYISSDEWAGDNNEVKIKNLEDIYKKAYKNGKQEFLIKNGYISSVDE